MFYVYLLKCSDNTFYTGCTGDLQERFARHQKGYVPATCEKLPVTLEFYAAFKERHRAFKFEKYLKSGSGFAFRNKHLI